MTCRGFLQFILKLLNFLLAMVSAAMVLYALWMLNEWYKHSSGPSPAPPPDESYDFPITLMESSNLALLPQQTETSEYQQMEPVEIHSFMMEQATKLEFSLFPSGLPAPWFIYAFLGAGIIACLITCTGHIAGETSSACCLSCYTVLLIMLLILQGAITATVFFDHTWREDLPKDPTGELAKIYDFVEENYDICKWVGLSVLIVEALALLFSLTLRAVLDPRKSGYDSDDDYLPRSQRQPLLNRQATTAGGAAPNGAPTESRPARSDEWSKRMREKYGLDTNEFTYNPSESKRVPQTGAVPTGEENKSCCTIM